MPTAWAQAGLLPRLVASPGLRPSVHLLSQPRCRPGSQCPRVAFGSQHHTHIFREKRQLHCPQHFPSLLGQPGPRAPPPEPRCHPRLGDHMQETRCPERTGSVSDEEGQAKG